MLKHNPKYFQNTWDYCNNKLKIAEKLIDHELKYDEVEKERQKTIQLEHNLKYEERISFLSAIESLGINLSPSTSIWTKY